MYFADRPRDVSRYLPSFTAKRFLEAFMKDGRVRALLTVALVMVSLTLRPAHAQSKPDPSLRDVLLERWTEIGQKVIKLAEEFPADKYDFKPVAEVRSFGDQLRHVAFWNEYVEKTARGEKIDPAINELPRSDYPTKDAVVAALRTSLQRATAELEKEPPALTPRRASLWVTFTEHSGEHYGQLVVYYRLNGIIPPESRGR
jgi:hypothetical protein